MMSREEFIQAYINKELTIDQSNQFDALVQSDPEFVKELNMAIVLKAAQNLAHKDYLKTLVKKDNTFLPSEKKPESKAKTINLFSFSRIAASIVFIIGLAFAYYFLNQSSPQQLAGNYWNQTDNLAQLSATLGSGDEDILKDAYLLYKKDNFKSCQELLNTFTPAEEADQLNKLLLMGMTQFEMGNYVAAIQQLKKVIDHPNQLFDDSANWFLALSYISNEQEEEGKKMLNTIVNTQSLNWQKAKQLLDQLN